MQDECRHYTVDQKRDGVKCPMDSLQLLQRNPQQKRFWIQNDGNRAPSARKFTTSVFRDRQEIFFIEH